MRIKGGAYLEAPARLRVIAFDKTGTLTYGHPVVQEVIPLNGHTERDLLACAAALEAHSVHPLARAILDKAASLGLTYTPAVNFTALQGKGAEATIDGTHFWIGSHRLMEDLGVENTAFHEMATRLEDAGHSLVAISNEKHICGLMSVADSIRPVAPAVVRTLKHLGMAHVVILSGDNQGTAQAVAAATGVDQCWAELLPEDKVRMVEELGQRFGPVAIVGVDSTSEANAFTSYDYTAYYHVVPVQRLETVMQTEAERMARLVMTNDILLPEQDEIRDERRAETTNVPEARFDEHMRAALYAKHPYGVPVPGWPDEVQRLMKKQHTPVLATHGRFSVWNRHNNESTTHRLFLPECAGRPGFMVPWLVQEGLERLRGKDEDEE